MDQITKIGKRLTNLSAGSPILTQMQLMLEHQQPPQHFDITDDSVLFHNLTSGISDPKRRREVYDALIEARKEEKYYTTTERAKEEEQE